MDRRAFLSGAACCFVSASSAEFARAQPAGAFAPAAQYSAERGGASLIVVRHGIVMAEDYPGGAPDARWPIGEGTRMFAPLLAASLVEDRLLSLDEPVSLTLGDWGAHPVKNSITIRMLLNGTSGLRYGRRDRNDLATAIALEPEENPGARFVDDAAPYVLFTEIARRKLDARNRGETDPARYLTSRTLLPIGCVPIGWTRGPDGPRFDEGASVSARGWAQAGELIRRLGVWRAQQLADDRALGEAMRGSFAEPRAGFGLWLATPGVRAPAPIESDLWSGASPAPPDLVMAAGAGGQRLYFSPSSGVVIARQSRSLGTRSQWSDAQFLSLVWRGLN
jgi:CubicO group peptidase (beta-lactamase class C family)